MVINMILAHINYLQMDVTDRLKNYGAHALLFLNIRRLGQQCQHLFLDPKNVKNSVSPVKKSLLPLKNHHHHHFQHRLFPATAVVRDRGRQKLEWAPPVTGWLRWWSTWLLSGSSSSPWSPSTWSWSSSSPWSSSPWPPSTSRSWAQLCRWSRWTTWTWPCCSWEAPGRQCVRHVVNNL